MTELLEAYGVEACIYGHLHGDGIAAGFTGERNGINYRLLSADSVGFRPVHRRISRHAMIAQYVDAAFLRRSYGSSAIAALISSAIIARLLFSM